MKQCRETIVGGRVGDDVGVAYPLQVTLKDGEILVGRGFRLGCAAGVLGYRAVSGNMAIPWLRPWGSGPQRKAVGDNPPVLLNIEVVVLVDRYHHHKRSRSLGKYPYIPAYPLRGLYRDPAEPMRRKGFDTVGGQP